MLRKNRLFTPGPTPILPAAQTAMASFAMHHRTADFRALFSRVLSDLKQFIGTNNDVLVLTASGTGAMEGAVSNLISPGDKVLVLSAGKFGERWRDLAKAFGCEVEVISGPYGETFSLDEIRRKLTPEIRAVYVQATESSTGARHDVEGIAKVVRASGDDTLLVVDAITGLGTTHLNVDGWGIDVIIGGSQKALMIPPGLAYCAISERAWRRMETAKSPRYYFDFRKERKAAAKGESAFTPATSMFAALSTALDFVRQMGDGDMVAGREALVNNAELAAAMTRAGAQALGLKLFSPSSPSAALTAIKAPAGVNSGAIVKEFRESFAAVVANGQGEMKGKLFRIAHIGYYDYLDTIGILAALEQVLASVTATLVEYGAGVRGAQQVYAKSITQKSQPVGAR
ncbi:MAG: L-aspartate aminotransferase / phosphoserine aminotransferase [Acidobacteriales bacterium 13_1_40CM_3_55_5]|nr:MAG: L-aspartate aminotransferase / phosphoserine aminotransferase [Acidobacteriales bacterium 13_1_40CM_3_55_5]